MSLSYGSFYYLEEVEITEEYSSIGRFSRKEAQMEAEEEGRNVVQAEEIFGLTAILYADEKKKKNWAAFHPEPMSAFCRRSTLNYLMDIPCMHWKRKSLKAGRIPEVSGRSNLAGWEACRNSSCMRLLSCISGFKYPSLAHEKGCASVLPWLCGEERISYTFFFAPPGNQKKLFIFEL